MAINRNYNVQQLYEELKYRYPGLSQTTVLETMKKHLNNRDRCIEDLNLMFMSQYRSSSSHNQFAIPNHYNQNHYGGGPTQTQPPNSVANSQNPNGPTSNLSAQPPFNLNATPPPPTYRQAVSNSRSHSVSGVPGGDGTNNSYSYGFKYANDPLQSPQSAPVTGGHYSPFIVSRANYYGSEREFAFGGAGGGPPKPPKPPVPPPTYRSHVEQHGGSGSYPSLYPTVPSFPKNVSSPPVRHKTSLNFVPINSNNRLRGGSGFDPWVSGGQSYGWTSQGAQNFHLGSSNAAPSNPYGASVRVVAPPPPPPPSMAPSQPYQSLLHISISPNGAAGGSAVTRHNQLSPSAAPMLQVQYPNDSTSPNATGAQSSPRVSPSDLYQRSLFDQDDPEQERISQRPLRPQPSPTNIGGSQVDLLNPSSRGTSPCWPYAHPSNPQAVGDVAYNEEAYSQALISHQKEQLTILQREHFRESLRLQEVRREVTKMEEDLFKRRTQFHDQVFPTMDDIQRLWSEIRCYSVDCSCMTRVVDLLHNGQVPLGETNEDFYKSINTGQQGPILTPTLLRRGISSEDRGVSYDQRSSPLHWSHPPPFPDSSSPSSFRGDDCKDQSDRSDDVGGGAAGEDDESQKWSCSACTFLNSLMLERCNMCEMPRVVLGVGGCGGGGQKHKVCIHVRQNSSCLMANKGVQLKLTHKLGAVKR